jgi:hypothetical protein
VGIEGSFGASAAKVVAVTRQASVRKRRFVGDASEDGESRL